MLPPACTPTLTTRRQKLQLFWAVRELGSERMNLVGGLLMLGVAPKQVFP